MPDLARPRVPSLGTGRLLEKKWDPGLPVTRSWGSPCQPGHPQAAGKAARMGPGEGKAGRGSAHPSSLLRPLETGSWAPLPLSTPGPGPGGLATSACSRPCLSRRKISPKSRI